MMKNKSFSPDIAYPSEQPGLVERKVAELIHNIGIDELLMSELIPNEREILDFTIGHPSNIVPNLKIIRENQELRVFMADEDDTKVSMEMRFSLDDSGILSFKSDQKIEDEENTKKPVDYAKESATMRFSLDDSGILLLEANETPDRKEEIQKAVDFAQGLIDLDFLSLCDSRTKSQTKLCR